MSKPHASKKLVGILALCLLAWFVVIQSELIASPHNRLIFWAGAIFAALIVIRREVPLDSTPPPDSFLCWTAVVGTLLALGGIVIPVHQFQWLGLLLMVYAGLRWSFPEEYGGNVASALFVLYWAHPLPDNLFSAVRLVLQQVSVGGAELCLHTFHIPVWADGLLLRTGTRVFEVPEACSGMNTARIVVVCALGAGALSSLSIAQRLVLMGAGVVQVLIMNSLRIAIMVALSWGKPPEWSLQFLHDSTSALLLFMIVLIQGEAWFWNWSSFQLELWRRKGGTTRTPSSFFDQRYSLPLLRLGVVGSVIFVLVLFLLLLDRRTPEYRATMIAGVADELAEHDAAQAERAALAASQLDPGNLAHKLLVARIQLMRGHHEQALARLRELRPVPRDDTFIQLMAWGLLGAGKLAEAEALLGHLSPAQAAHPGIAICKTELAIRRGDAELAASNVVVAAKWPPFRDRIRRTYPFLAHHGKWSAIARSADLSAFRDPTEFRILLVALTTENDLPKMERLLENNRAIWHGNPDFLPHLQELALRNTGASWQQHFFGSLQKCMEGLSADELTANIEPCLLLGRPEFAWLAYRRLSRLDPAHPALTLFPARFAPSWFAFRGGTFLPDSRSPAITDMRPFFRLAAPHEPWKGLLLTVPLRSVMLAGPTREQTSRWLAAGLAEIERRETGGELSYEQYKLYENTLTWAGRDNAVLAVLNRMEKQFPDRNVEILSRRASFYHTRKLWQPLYETVRQIKALRPHLDRPMQLLLAETLAHLEMGVCALELSAEAAQQQPTERSGRLMLAMIWKQFGHAEEALFTLQPFTPLPPNESMAELLWESGRYAQASQLYGILGMTREADRRPVALPVLPSAESVLKWPSRNLSSPPFSLRDLDEQIRNDTSPFLRQLHTLTREWVDGRNRQRINDPAVWKQAGRDSLEQVTALHRFAFLAADSGDLAMCRRALDQALLLMPSSRLLWRMQIAAADGDPKVIASARAACPDDPEIWLAELAQQIREKKSGVAAQSLREACANNRYPSATIVRAGQALLRAGDAATATVAAKQAGAQSRDYLPACLLALDAALASKDTEATIMMALKTADLAPDPLPFFRMAVRLGMARPGSQLSLTRALDTLIAGEPGNPEWGLRLGTLYFKEGLFDLSRRAFEPWMAAPPAGTEPAILIMMAESARRAGTLGHSLAVLREAYRRHPAHIHVINSLAYTLAQSPATAMEARSFLPRLMNAPPTPSILDTIAVVRMRTGEMEAVRQAAKDALAKLKPGDSHWREIHLNAAEIECTLGHAAEAEKLLKKAREQPPAKGSSIDDRMASLELKIIDLKQGTLRPAK